jgi:SAM-dependent methyltransferase
MRDELMDTEIVRFEELRDCLVDLARVNRLTRAYRPTLLFLDRLLPQIRRLDRPLEIVDVGSGYGDMLRAIDDWAHRRGVSVSLTGIDLNPWSSRAAAQATPKSDIRWVTSDLFAYMPPHAIDVVTSSLFTHHLADPLVARFLRWMETNARVGWFVSDLHRHPLPYHFFRCFSWLARLHRFVQHDGPVSISRAFVRADWERLLGDAGIAPAIVEICWRWPFRITLERVKCAHS